MLEDFKGLDYNGCMDLVGVSYNETRAATRKYELHCHNFYEVYYFQEGEVDYLVEGQQYKFGAYSALYRAYVRILGYPPLKDRGVLPPFGL